jgi:hypothetical protein
VEGHFERRRITQWPALQTAQQLRDRSKHRSHRWEGSGDKLTKRIAILGAIVKDVLMVKAEGVVVVVLMELTD